MDPTRIRKQKELADLDLAARIKLSRDVLSECRKVFEIADQRLPRHARFLLHGTLFETFDLVIFAWSIGPIAHQGAEQFAQRLSSDVSVEHRVVVRLARAILHLLPGFRWPSLLGANSTPVPSQQRVPELLEAAGEVERVMHVVGLTNAVASVVTRTLVSTSLARRLTLTAILDTDGLRASGVANTAWVRLRGLTYLTLGYLWAAGNVSLVALVGLLGLGAFVATIAYGPDPPGREHMAQDFVWTMTMTVICLVLLVPANFAWKRIERPRLRALERAFEWQRYGRLAWSSAEELAAHSCYVEKLLEQRQPFVLLLRNWGTSFGHFSDTVDVSAAARWARVAASTLPVVALAEPDTWDVHGVVTPAVPRRGWERMITRLIPAAHAIVIVVEASAVGRGLEWEIECLTAAGRLKSALLFVYRSWPRTHEFSLVLENQSFSTKDEPAIDDALRHWIRTSDVSLLAQLPSFQRATTPN